MEDKKVKDSINIKAVQERIETLKVTIQMLTKTLGEMVLLDTPSQSTMKMVKEVIKDNEKEMVQLKQVLKDEEERNFPKFVSSEYWKPKKSVTAAKNEDEKLERGVVANICDYKFYESIMECGFIVNFPDYLGVVASDVMNYRDVGDRLVITVRNNVSCPILKFQKALNDSEICNKKIQITTLDACGSPLYVTDYKIKKFDSYETSGGNYNSNDPQTITLYFIISTKEINEPTD